MLNGSFNMWLAAIGDRMRAVHGSLLCKPEMEPVYQALLHRDLAAHGITDDFYAVGGAANHSLLYLILRCFGELDLGHVLELGSGQSSVLMDRMNLRRPRDRRIFSLEHDAFWAETVQHKVRHPVLLADLRCDRFRGFKTYAYDWAGLPQELSFELLIIDGPPAADAGLQYARLGALDVLPRLASRGFVVIIDDAERAGERLLARKVIAALLQAGHQFKVSEALAAKRQIVIASGVHRAAAYF